MQLRAKLRHPLSFQVLGTSPRLATIFGETALDCPSATITKSTFSLFLCAIAHCIALSFPRCVMMHEKMRRRVSQRHFLDLQYSDRRGCQTYRASLMGTSLNENPVTRSTFQPTNAVLWKTYQGVEENLTMACEHFISLMLQPFQHHIARRCKKVRKNFGKH